MREGEELMIKYAASIFIFVFRYIIGKIFSVAFLVIRGLNPLLLRNT